MSYQVLARKYRSAGFDDLIGQDAISTTLKNALLTDRVHHGYLFTGTRGVGKTSTARILAKALNCLESDAPTPTPCFRCASCIAVAEGEDIDVVEIDAASNTGVDNMRELRNHAAFRPARSRFKVYIIDEVHMLSMGAFNALLKTLEEPPDHVKFILATTELQKVPATIQSRCQRFTFRAVGPDVIADHLRFILKEESIEAEDAVVRRISRLANGSVRDALSLLDKALSFESVKLTTALFEQLLPPSHDEHLFVLVDHLAKGDTAAALVKLDEVLAGGQTVPAFCDGLIEHLRTLMLIRVCGGGTPLVDVPEQVLPKLVEQAGAFDPQTFVYMITLVEELRRGAKYGGAARALADAVMVRLGMSARFSDIAELIGCVPDAHSPGSGVVVEKKKSSLPSATVSQRPAPARDSTHRSTGNTGASSVVEAAAASPSRASVSGVRPAVTSSAQRQAVEKDPAVQLALELTEGTLVDVRPVSEADPGASA